MRYDKALGSNPDWMGSYGNMRRQAGQAELYQLKKMVPLCETDYLDDPSSLVEPSSLMSMEPSSIPSMDQSSVDHSSMMMDHTDLSTNATRHSAAHLTDIASDHSDLHIMDLTSSEHMSSCSSYSSYKVLRHDGYQISSGVSN